MIDWLKRAKKRPTAVAEVWAYDSRCGRYRVECHKSTLACEQRGAPTAKGGKRKTRKQTWFAMLREQDCWVHVDPNKRTFTTRNAAERMCEAHANN